MGKTSRRPSLKMAAVIRKKSKAKRERLKKEAKTKQYPKRSKKLLIAPLNMPNRESVQQEIHDTTVFVQEQLKPLLNQPQQKGKKYDAQLEQYRKLIIEQQKANFEKAQTSYNELLSALEQAQAVIEVLDARDPNACRLLNAEGEVLGQHKKPLLLVLTKIDLVPRESVTRWMHELGKVAKCVAINALDNATAPNVLAEALQQIAPTAQLVAVIGPHGVGKSTIVNMNSNILKEVESYKFLQPTPEGALLDLCEWIDPAFDLALETISRSQDDSIFTVIGIKETEDPENVLHQCSASWGMKPKLVAERIIASMRLQGVPYHWFAVPPEKEATDLSQTQLAALESSIPMELAGFEYMHIATGDSLKVNEIALRGEIPEEEEEDENDGKEEEEDQE